eukprot:Phypoly_transcript_18436.p1 GENE.Phypoly_transcript_18436~~Phypoly_transcript_18436.p1  ORF type:complete len:127 (+),score=15.71 Phypoly_transcript_18436:225-605(+)
MTTETVLLRVKQKKKKKVISKTFKVSPGATVHSAVSDVIGKSLQQTVSVNSNYGLYLPKQQQWLDDSLLISDVQSALVNEEFVELKDRLVVSKTNSLIVGAEITYGLIGFLLGAISTYLAVKVFPH